MGWILRLLALGYPLSLLSIVLALRLIGERWWFTTVLMYLPRAGFCLPLPFITFALLWVRPRWWLLTQAVSLVLLVFPLMGLRLSLPSLPSSADAGATRIRVFSFNIAGVPDGLEGVMAQIQSAHPDLVLLQEAWADSGERLRQHFPEYHFHLDGQLVVASRYPIIDTFQPPKIPHLGQMRSPRWGRLRIALPGGQTIAVYDLHPMSPRDGFQDMRGEGLRSELRSGHILTNKQGWESVRANAELRRAQIQAATEDAARSTDPVLLAGDTNLPGLSWLLGHYLGRYQDGFSKAGNGLGYTFPSAPRRPWMRIDRIFADDNFRFLKFSVVNRRASDHYAVVADLEFHPPH